MSVYGSYPPSSGYDYNAPTSVVVPPLPNENHYYQLPDAHYQGTTTAVNRYHQQDVYYNDKVIVEDHIIWQPIHQRVYKYVPPTVTQGPIRSWTEGQEPPLPTANIGSSPIHPSLPYSGASSYSNAYPINSMYGADPYGASGANNPQMLLQQLVSTVLNLPGSLQQWMGSGF